jgi:hypothetical protein
MDFERLGLTRPFQADRVGTNVHKDSTCMQVSLESQHMDGEQTSSCPSSEVLFHVDWLFGLRVPPAERLCLLVLYGYCLEQSVSWSNLSHELVKDQEREVLMGS